MALLQLLFLTLSTGSAAAPEATAACTGNVWQLLSSFPWRLSRGGAWSSDDSTMISPPTKESSPPMNIDESLYSRQLYVLGRDAQRRLQQSRMLVVGLSGTGVEVVKNVALAGVSELALYDPSPVCFADLATHYYATEADVAAGRSRAEACAVHLASLNPHVRVTVLGEGGRGSGTDAGAAAALVASGLYGVAVAVDQPVNVQLAMNQAARSIGSEAAATAMAAGADGTSSSSVAFIACGARGVFGSIFCDFGESFLVRDPTGATPQPSTLAELRLLPDDESVEVTCAEGEKHGLSPGQRIHLKNVCWQSTTTDPINVWAKVKHVHNPLTLTVEFIDSPEEHSAAAAASSWSSRADALRAMPSAAAAPLSSGATLSRPKSEEAAVLRFSPLGDVLTRPAVSPPPRKKRRKKETDEQWAARCPPAEEMAQAAALAAAEREQMVYDEAVAAVARLEKNTEEREEDADAADDNAMASLMAARGRLATLQRRRARSAAMPIVGCDWEKAADRSRVATVHACWHVALPRFRARFGGRDPAPAVRNGDEKAFFELLREAFADNDRRYDSVGGGGEEEEKEKDGEERAVNLGRGVALDELTARAFVHSCGVGGNEGGCSPGGLVPVTSFVGGVAAQEVLKALSGVFSPIHQFLFFDAAEALMPLLLRNREGASSFSIDGDDEDDDEGYEEGYDEEDDDSNYEDEKASDFAPRGDRYDGLRAVVGEQTLRRLRHQRWFVVGAGAIGCELLKNLALMGVGSAGSECAEGGKDGGGEVVLTDMDTIERSNLNRQFLFRPPDVGKPKSEAAAAAARAMSGGRLNIRPLQAPVGAGESEDGPYAPFGDGFWRSLDGVLTALDNVEARLFVDSRAVRHKKVLVDAGTLGAKGNVQVVLPHLTESYGDSADPPEAATPVCTLKSFPYKIEHTIQWARELFDEQFRITPQNSEELVGIMTAALKDPFVAGPRLPSQLEARFGGEEDGLNAAEAAAKACETVASAVEEAKSDFLLLPETLEVGAATAFIQRQMRSRLAWACEDWAVRHAMVEVFHRAIASLRRQYPLDALDPDTGRPFWSGGTRRRPDALHLDASDAAQVAFVAAAARLRFEMLAPLLVDPPSPGSGLAESWSYVSLFSAKGAAAAIERFATEAKAEQPGAVKEGEGGVSSDDKEAVSDNAVVGAKEAVQARLRNAVGIIAMHAAWRGGDQAHDDGTSMFQKKAASGDSSNNEDVGIPAQWTYLSKKNDVEKGTAASYREGSAFAGLSFEKDDDANGHLDFVAAASNLRARAYGIPQADRLGTKLVAGRIVPAIATTTAVVAGLSCLELLKIAVAAANPASSTSGHRGIAVGTPVTTLDSHRNAFLSLSAPLFAFSEPVPAAVFPYGNNDLDIYEREERGGGGGVECRPGDGERRTTEFTIWDSLDVWPRSCGDDGKAVLHLTLGELIATVEARAGEGGVVRSLSIAGGGGGGKSREDDENGAEQQRIVFADFAPFNDPARLQMTVPDAIRAAAKGGGTGVGDDAADFAGRGGGGGGGAVAESLFLESRCFVDLEVLVEDEDDGELLDMPAVRYHLAER